MKRMAPKICREHVKQRYRCAIGGCVCLRRAGAWVLSRSRSVF